MNGRLGSFFQSAVICKFRLTQKPTDNMRKSALLLMTIVLNATIFCLGQTAPQVVVPKFSDKFCHYIQQIEAGQTDIDYQDFRFSFIESEQFKIASKKSSEFDSLKKEMYAKMDKSNYHEIIKITKQILSIDYTSMIAHKILRQT
jgi:capsular polysaccharide biosynthesis protein